MKREQEKGEEIIGSRIYKKLIEKWNEKLQIKQIYKDKHILEGNRRIGTVVIGNGAAASIDGVKPGEAAGFGVSSAATAYQRVNFSVCSVCCEMERIGSLIE